MNSFNKLNEDIDFNNIEQYIRDDNFIGVGMGKRVYRYGDKVIAEAKDDNGRTQIAFQKFFWNKHKHGDYRDKLNPVLYVSEDYNYMVSPYCGPCSDTDDYIDDSVCEDFSQSHGYMLDIGDLYDIDNQGITADGKCVWIDYAIPEDDVPLTTNGESLLVEWDKVLTLENLIGIGTSRAVFAFGDYLVIKIPLNKNGVLQNKSEVNIINNLSSKFSDYIPDYYYVIDSCLITRYIRPLNRDCDITCCNDYETFKIDEDYETDLIKRISELTGVSISDITEEFFFGLNRGWCSERLVVLDFGICKDLDRAVEDNMVTLREGDTFKQDVLTWLKNKYGR